MDEYDSLTSSLLELNSCERGLRGAHASDSLRLLCKDSMYAGWNRRASPMTGIKYRCKNFTKREENSCPAAEPASSRPPTQQLEVRARPYDPKRPFQTPAPDSDCGKGPTGHYLAESEESVGR